MTGPVDLAWARAAARFDMSRLRPYLDLLGQLVNLDTPSREVAGLSSAFGQLRHELEKRGLGVRMVAGDDGVPVMVADGGNTSGHPRIGFLGHLDTVFGPTESHQRPFRVDARTATGPGVADMKAGLVSMLYVIDLLANHAALPPLRIVVNGDEEVGSVTSRAVLHEMLGDRDAIFVFEPGRPGGNFVSHRRGTLRAHLSSHGIAAHSGVVPRSGANAIHDLAGRISAVAALGKHYPDCDINVTVIEGGRRVNIIPDQASCEIDARTASRADDESLRRDIEQIANMPGFAGTSTAVQWGASRPPLEASAAQTPLLEAFRDTAAAIGVEFRAVGTGGGSDANLIGDTHAAILDGCGPVGDNYHRVDEYVEVPTIASRAALVAAGALVYAQRRDADA